MPKSSLVFVAESGSVRLIESSALTDTPISFPEVGANCEMLLVGGDSNYLFIQTSSVDSNGDYYHIISLGLRQRLPTALPEGVKSRGCALHPSLPLVAFVTSYDLYVFNIDTNIEVFHITTSSPAWFTQAGFSSDGKFLVGDGISTSSARYTVKIFNVSDWSVEAELVSDQYVGNSYFGFSHDCSVFYMASLANDGRSPAFYSTDTWELYTNAETLTEAGQFFGEHCSAASDDGRWIAMKRRLSSTPFGVYDMTDMSVVSASFPTMSGYVLGLLFSPGSRYLVIYNNRSPYIRAFDTSDWSAVTGIQQPYYNSIFDCAFSNDGRYLFVVGAFYGVYVYDTENWTASPIVIGTDFGRVRRIETTPRSLLVDVSGKVMRGNANLTRQVCLVSRNYPPTVISSGFSSPVDGSYSLSFFGSEATRIVMGDGNEEPDIKRVIAE